MYDTPSHISQLLTPSSAKKPTSRKAWSIDLENRWIPFFTASNVMGKTDMPLDAIGAPIRLQYSQDGQVKFSKTGKPVTKIATPLHDGIMMVKANFEAGLDNFAQKVQKERTADFSRHVKMAIEQGKPITAHDTAELDKAIQLQIEAEKVAVLAEAERVTNAVPVPEPEKEKVTA